MKIPKIPTYHSEAGHPLRRVGILTAESVDRAFGKSSERPAFRRLFDAASRAGWFIWRPPYS